MTQVPPLFHHYSLMKGLGLETGIAGEEEASLAHPFSTTHQTSTNQEQENQHFSGCLSSIQRLLAPPMALKMLLCSEIILEKAGSAENQQG